MVVCKYFLNGNCKYGDRCRYEHVRSQGNSRSDYGQDYHDSHNRNYVKQSKFQNQGNFSSPFHRQTQESSTSQQPSTFQHRQKNDRYHWTPTSNRFAPLNDLKNDVSSRGSSGGGESDDLAVIRSVQEEIQTWVSNTMWPYSCYALGKNKRCVEGLPDIQPEELRTIYYLHGVETYRKLVPDLAAMYAGRKQELMQMSNETKASVLTTAHSNSPTSPSSCLSIFYMYGPDHNFKHSPDQQQAQFSMTSVQQAPQQPAPSAGTLTSSFTSPPPPPAEGEPIETQETAPPQPAKSLSLFKSGPSSQSSSTHDHVYTDEAILTEPELAEFKASSFTLGKIPMRPPPKGYCR